MASTPERHPWWDRETDESGRIIRADVRESAHTVFARVAIHARSVLGDDCDAPQLLESAVAAVSRYLDKNCVPLYSADLAGLVLVAFHRLTRRLGRQRGRLQPIGDSSVLSEMLRAPDQGEQIERHILLQQLARKLSDRTRGILRLKLAGYEWEEIAEIMKTTSSAARNSFWRELRRAYLELLRAPHGKSVGTGTKESKD